MLQFARQFPQNTSPLLHDPSHLHRIVLVHDDEGIEGRLYQYIIDFTIEIFQKIEDEYMDVGLCHNPPHLLLVVVEVVQHVHE